MVTIAIPSYNHARFLKEAVRSALWQDYKDKEILIIDDASTDGATRAIKRQKGVRILKNKRNIGFYKTMNRLIKEAKGKYIVFLCDDDLFNESRVVSDMVKIFESDISVGVIDRNYFQFIFEDDKLRIVARSDENNVLISATNPSGIGIRKSMAKQLKGKTYAEMAHMIKEMNCKVKKLTYDAVAVRLHQTNQALDPNYYKQSIIWNWEELLGKDSKVIWDFRSNYVTWRLRGGWGFLKDEIVRNVRVQPKILRSCRFYIYAGIALLTPRPILLAMVKVYRRTKKAEVMRRYHGPMILNLGCGMKQRNDSINVDTRVLPGVDQVTDLGVFPWPWANESIDGIYASHIIEHFPDQKKVLSECIRILKPGGFLRLNLPHSSSVTSIGCMGHYRTYSYSTCRQYLGENYYMFGKAMFRTVEQKLLWWYEECDAQGELTPTMRRLVMLVAPVLNWLARLNPHICENLWCFWVGGFREVVWKGIKNG